MPIRNIPLLGNGDFKRPCLPIKIINPHTAQSLKTIALVDTGADECAIPARIAPLLGHNLSLGSPNHSSTAGGVVNSYSHTTRIEIYNFEDILLHTINDIPIDYMEGLPVPLLGVKHFLDQFDLHILYPKKIFSIQWP